jgi:hypothetical protein
MTIATQIIEKELERNERMIREYENELLKLPKGKLTIKKINSHSYYYLKYRQVEKVITKYVGKNNCDLSELNNQLDRRNHIEEMLKQLKIERKELEKLRGRI